MPVPGVWELNGYGHPIYVNVGYPWRNQFNSNPPAFPTENNNVGSYRREIVVPANWKGKDIIAHTDLIGGGESATVEFTVTEAGTYDFLCSFPGHSAIMKGKLIAE